MRLSGQFLACLFFFYEKVLTVKNAPKRKTNDFHPLRTFCAHKKCCLCCLVFVQFCFLGEFFLVSVFLRSKPFRQKKRTNRLEVVLITSFTILLTCAPINPPIENLFVLTYFYF